MAYPLLARGTQEAWAKEKGFTPPRWSAGIGTKGDIYTARAKAELAAGNITPRLGISEGRAYTASQYYAVLGRMKELNPELAAYHEAMVAEGKTVKPSGDRIARLKVRMDELRELKGSYFYRDIDWVTKWLIEEEIKRLSSLAVEEGGEPEPLRAPTITAPEYMGELYESGYGLLTETDRVYPGETAEDIEIYKTRLPFIPYEGDRSELYEPYVEGGAIPTEQATYGAPGRLPIPSWLGKFLETSMGPAGEAGMARGAYALRPMGAQAELGTEKLGQMAGYLGWGKAGAPLKFEESYLQALEQLPGWWEEYTALSEKLFPKAVQMPKPTWQATYQR